MGIEEGKTDKRKLPQGVRCRRVQFTLPPRLLGLLDDLASHRQVSRSEVVRSLLTASRAPIEQELRQEVGL